MALHTIEGGRKTMHEFMDHLPTQQHFPFIRY